MKRFLIIIGIIFCGITLHAQDRYFPIKGEVVSADSLTPIIGAHIISMISYYGTTTDLNGRFVMQIRKSDSLRISSVGFMTKTIFIDHDSIDVNNLEILMERDTILLQEVDVTPWHDFSTVKEMVRTAPAKEVFIMKGVNDNIEKVLYQKPKKIPDDKGILSPVQTLYNRFNKKARLKRKLERNRERYGYDPEI